MVFKRRDPIGWGAWMREMIYPRGGFRRAIRYVVHRMRRLPDTPHRVARGIFVGSVIGFLPLPGLQFVGAWFFARLLRGNLLAALLATFNTNPLTTPFFAVLSITLGHWMLGIEKPLSPEYIGHAFARAGHDLWFNATALFSDRVARWDGLTQFWNEIYVPYFIGSLGPAIILSLIAYYITIPLVTAYQKARAAKARERGERRHRLRNMLTDAGNRLKHARDHGEPPGDDSSPGEP